MRLDESKPMPKMVTALWAELNVLHKIASTQYGFEKMIGKKK